MGFEVQHKLPIIDLNEQNFTPGTDSWVSTSYLVRSALESHGCFLAKFNKISSDLQHKIFNLSEDLFQLPTEIKVQNTSNILGFGYGTNFSFMPLVEYFGIENAATVEATKEFTNQMYPAGNDIFWYHFVLILQFFFSFLLSFYEDSNYFWFAPLILI